MKTASITETKNRLSALLDEVRRGETIIILDRNRPVARLEPISEEPEWIGEAQFARLEREGLLRRSRKPLSSQFLKSNPPASRARKSLLDALLEERRENP